MLEGLQPIKRVFECPVDEFLKTLDETDTKIMQEALNDERSWNAHALHVALKSRGVIINDKSIRKHRLGDCSC